MSVVAAVLLFAAFGAGAGELKKDYFGATKPGAWVEQALSSPDGSKSTYTSQRLPDEDGHVVLALSVKVIAGAGAGSESKNICVMPVDFNLARDFLSYGKFTEKMTMEFSGMKMPVDNTTLDAIRKGSKDYRGGVTFEGSETIDGRSCDRYAYSISIAGPAPSKEAGKLWLDPTLPFGIVRQTAKVLKDDGSVASEYEIKLTGSGLDQSMASVASPPVETPAPAPLKPSVVGLVDGLKAGQVAIDVSVVSGSKGRKLELVLRNKTDAQVTVNVPAGDLDIPGSPPVDVLRVTFAKQASLIIPPEESAAPVSVAQRGTRGPVEGKFTLSCYEGTPLFSGSATLDSLSR